MALSKLPHILASQLPNYWWSKTYHHQFLIPTPENMVFSWGLYFGFIPHAYITPKICRGYKYILSGYSNTYFRGLAIKVFGTILGISIFVVVGMREEDLEELRNPDTLLTLYENYFSFFV